MFMYPWTIADTSLSIGFDDLHDQVLIDAKNWFHANWPNDFNFPPHIGLVYLPYPQNLYKPAFQKALDFVKNWHESFSVKILAIVFETNSSGDIFVKLQIDQTWLLDQHLILLDELRPLRPDGAIRTKDLERINLNKYSKEELEVLYHDGFIRNRDRYDPHISLGLIKKEIWSEQIKSQIETHLANLIDYQIRLNHVHIVFHTDAVKQTDMQAIDRADIYL